MAILKAVLFLLLLLPCNALAQGAKGSKPATKLPPKTTPARPNASDDPTQRMDFTINHFGIGLMIGIPTGLTGKYWLDTTRAIDATIALTGSETTLQATWLWHKAAPFKLQSYDLDWYYGLGARLRTDKDKRNDEDMELGPRAPIGLRHQLQDPKVELFAEAAMIFDLIEESDLDFAGGIGARYFF